MQEYGTPMIEIVYFEADDIVTTSITDGEGDV